MRLFFALIVSFLMAAVPAMACSTRDDYKIPTNFELVEKAQLILLARVVEVPTDFKSAMEGGSQETWVKIEPVRVLKGAVPSEPPELMGWQAPEGARGVPPVTTLNQSHFSSGLGACIRQFYTPGELVVAMFEPNAEFEKQFGRKLIQQFYPFARSVETVADENDIWVRAVERYVALQAGEPATIKQRIETDIQKLRLIPTPEAQAVAADLDYHVRREDRSGIWANFSMSNFTVANVPGQKGAQLYCIVGTPPGVMLADAPAAKPPRIMVDGVAFAASTTTPTPAEQAMLKPSRGLGEDSDKVAPISIFRLSDPATLGALRTAVKSVGVAVDGKPIISGQPLDALFRWVSQCEKLTKLPAPTEEELRRPSM